LERAAAARREARPLRLVPPDDIDAILGARLHNPVDMTVQQREGPIDDAELEPCFLVRGIFESMGVSSDGEHFTAMRWVHLEDIVATLYDFEENERGELFDFAERALDAAMVTASRLLEAARTVCHHA